jgi:large subunit ribosomal protein L25
MKLKLEKREDLGKNKVKQIRAEGKVPAVVYGLEKEPVSVLTTPRDLIDLFKNPLGTNIVFEGDVAGKKEKLITYRIERDAISQEVLHVDFLRVEDSRPIKVDVPLILEGVAPGQKMGGVLIQKTSELRIHSVPGNIPEKIVIDLSKMQIGDYVKVKDIPTEDKFVFITNNDDTVVRIAAPRKVVAGAEGAAEAGEEAGEEGAAEGGEEGNSEE